MPGPPQGRWGPRESDRGGAGGSSGDSDKEGETKNIQLVRKLIYVSIMHTSQDFGSLEGKLPRSPEAANAQGFWREVTRVVKGLDLDWRKVRVYQDGLPRAGEENVRGIVDQAPGPNYALLRWLRAQGARVVGTESASLLGEEYYRLKLLAEASEPQDRARRRDEYSRRAAALLEERDQFIAARIDETLGGGETGLLFIGKAHRVRGMLSPDIQVVALSEAGGSPGA